MQTHYDRHKDGAEAHLKMTTTHNVYTKIEILWYHYESHIHGQDLNSDCTKISIQLKTYLCYVA